MKLNLIVREFSTKKSFIRKIEATLDFNFIYYEAEELYSTIGVQSINPIVLIRIV